MNQAKNKLVITTPSELEIVLTREFDAPKDLVFEAWTNPIHVKNWWGPDCVEMSECEIDLRVGGAFRYGTQSPDGSQHPFIGVFREIERPSRLVHTFIYDIEPYNQFEAVFTVLFEDINGRTRMTETILHKTTEARDGHLYSGMEQGAAMALDQLEALLARL